MKVAKFRRAADTASLAALLFIAFMLIISSEKARNGALSGFTLAINTIIPSLLPLLMIFLTVMKSGAKRIIIALFGKITQIIFNLPGAAAPAVLFGLVGGYPTGVILTAELFENGDISERQAQRMMRFNFCGGCGFIITALGSTVYGSTAAGVLLFASNAAVCVILGVLCSFEEKRSKNPIQADYSAAQSFAEALGDSAHSACSSVLMITAFVALFSAVTAVLNLPADIAPYFEITNGLCTQELPLSLAAAFLQFGGFCIHFQLVPYIKSVRMKYFEFLVFRVIAAAFSFCAMTALAALFPQASTVFSQSVGKFELSSVNAVLSVLLILGCFVCVFDLSGKKHSIK